MQITRSNTKENARSDDMCRNHWLNIEINQQMVPKSDGEADVTPERISYRIWSDVFDPQLLYLKAGHIMLKIGNNLCVTRQDRLSAMLSFGAWQINHVFYSCQVIHTTK